MTCCIKKNGLFLAYRENLVESDYWEDSVVNAYITSQWYWAENSEYAKVFIDDMQANKFLVRKKGNFWAGSTVEIYRY